jgi:FixJ family two-component response regulator
MVTALLALLEQHGYNAKGIYSARTIISDVRYFDPDVIIMDIEMPGKADGMLPKIFASIDPANGPC